MSLMEVHPAGHLSLPGSLSHEGLRVLCQRVAQSAIAPEAPGGGEAVAQVVRAAIEAYITTSGDVHAATGRVARLLHEIGEREAHRWPDATRLDQSFRMAHTAVQRGLGLVTGDLVSRDALVRVREDLMAYVNRLHHVARGGFDHASTLLAMTDDERSREIAAAVFDQASSHDLAHLSRVIGVAANSSFVAVVATAGPLPAGVLTRPGAIVRNRYELLLPDVDDLVDTLNRTGQQVVMGPSTPLAQSGHAVALARRAATLLRTASIDDSRCVVPCTDVLGILAVDSNPLLAELARVKHLSALEATHPTRRLNLAEMCLHWLERGVPMNRLARELDIPPQTAHNRMQAIRSLFGAALDEPVQRFELIVALRSVLPRWRNEA